MHSVAPHSALPSATSIGLTADSNEQTVDLRFGARYAASVADEAVRDIAAQVSEVLAQCIRPGSVITLGPGTVIERTRSRSGDDVIAVNGVVMNHVPMDSDQKPNPDAATAVEALNFLREVLDPLAPPIIRPA